MNRIVPRPASSNVLQTSFERELLPLLELLGFERAQPNVHARPGFVVECASRAYKEGWRIEAWLWCDAASFRNLHFQIAEIESGEGSRGIVLELPWAGERGLLEFAANEFLPCAEGGPTSTEQLERAVSFLAGALAACSEQLVRELPGLTEAVGSAAHDARWVAARQRSEALWQEHRAPR